VETDYIQLIALTCLWINLKREALFIEIPSVMKSFVSTDMLHGNIFSPIESIQEDQTVFPDEFALLFRRQRCCNWQRTYTQEKQLLLYEKKILAVNFNICFADPLLFYYI